MSYLWKQKITQAIQETRILSIQYKKKTTGKYDQYEIVPIDIASETTKDGKHEEYLLAFKFATYPQEDDYRKYLLENFYQISLTDKRFDPEPYVRVFSQIVKAVPSWNIPRKW